MGLFYFPQVISTFPLIRNNQDKKHMMAFKVSVISSQAEYDAHMLEVVWSKLKLRQLKDQAYCLYINNSAQ